jgi:hypothetical protein
VWFVAKRLAYTVRDYIVTRAGDGAGIPGAEKNDRLFDTWQEYGQLMLNPQSGQAIWNVKVHGDAGPGGQGYCHSLSMLRFPLAKLWPDQSNYPSAMAGRIEVVVKVKPGAETTEAQNPQAGAVQTTEPVATVTGAASPAGTVAVPTTASNSTKSAAADLIPAPRFAQDTSSKKKGKRKAAVLEDPDDFLPSDETSRAAARAERHPTAAAPSPVAAATVTGADADAEPAATSWSPHAAQPAVASTTIGRVALHTDASPPKAAKGAREPSEAAIAFMQWVQQGLGEGSLKYNEAGATVHFVEAGLALVSPAIFREYAERFGEPAAAPGTSAKSGADRVGLSIQREVLRAGWHVPSPADGTNIWTFNVSRRGGAKTSKLSAVVLADARRWVMEPPPPNPTLQLPGTETDKT